ncbi:MAG: uroporphyrinogen decarboxylase [Polyangia bacterium]
MQPTSRKTRFLAACAGLPVDTTPIWIMRQAGRYLPEYQRTRARAGDFLTLCKTPELACEVTLQPIERLGVDAAILFSDILVPLQAMGLELTFTDEGPRLQRVHSAEDIAALRVPDTAACGFVYDAVRLIRRELDGVVPLIGFAGAPFTMLTYAVEGQTGKQFVHTKRLLFKAPDQAHALLEKLTATVIEYLRGQVAAGAQALQLFDSWVGILGVEDFETFAAPYVRRILEALRPLGVPLIYFAHGGGTLLEEVGKLPADVFALDWRLPIDVARRRLGLGEGADERRAVQGNLDPLVLLGPIGEIERRAGVILQKAPARGHIFNLGHGIVPETPVEHAQALVEFVHRTGRRE